MRTPRCSHDISKVSPPLPPASLAEHVVFPFTVTLDSASATAPTSNNAGAVVHNEHSASRIGRFISPTVASSSPSSSSYGLFAELVSVSHQASKTLRGNVRYRVQYLDDTFVKLTSALQTRRETPPGIFTAGTESRCRGQVATEVQVILRL